MIPRALVLVAFAATVSAQAGPDWAQVTPAASPGTRRAGAMAFDSVSNRLIAFGGISVAPSAILGETWAYGATAPAAGNWTQPTVGGSPPPRWGHKMVRNTVNNRLLTFGGRSPTIGAFANDTWEFTGVVGGGSWAQVPIPAASRPSPRYLYGLAFDEARNVAILFGGSNAVTTFGDTWEYNHNTATWTQVPFAPEAAPSPREDMVLVYDAALNRTVLFGGYDPVTALPLGDTWLYDGSAWTLQLPAAVPPATQVPSSRFSASAIYDSVRKRVVLFGGFDGGPKDDTYEFSGSAWLPVAGAGLLPPNATETYSGYDPVRRKFVVYGGFGTIFTNQTWELTVPTGVGQQPGLFGAFTAAGCLTGLGNPPVISGTTPTIGQQLVITCATDANQPAPVFAVVFLGFSNRTFNGLPLPIDLGVLGFGNCPLLVAADLLAGANLAGNTSTLPVAVPNNATLVNLVLYAQGAFLDSNLFLQTTPGARAVIGQ